MISCRSLYLNREKPRQNSPRYPVNAGQIRDPATGQPGSAEQDRLSAHAPSRTTSAPCAPVPCQFQLSGRNLDQAAEGYRQCRVASRRTLSPRWLHRDEHEPPGRARRCFLQQARDVRAMDQGGQRRDQVDATVVPNVRRQRGAAPASCARLQPGNFLRTLATPEPIKDWSLTTLKDKLIKIGAKVVSHGRYVIFQMAEVAIARQMFQEILRLIAELRPQPPSALA